MTVARELERVWGVKSRAAGCLIRHGQVKIDGVPVTDSKQPAVGQFLQMFQRESRLSSRVISVSSDDDAEATCQSL